MKSVVVQRVNQYVRAYAMNPTVQQGVVLLVANTLGNALQYIFHAFVSRAMGPDEYGVFASLLALYVIVNVPTGIAQTVITQYVARFRARNEMSRVGALFVDSLKYLSLAGVGVFALVAVVSAPIASFLNVPSALPVIAMASIFLIAGGSTVVSGTLQGLQRFYVISANGVLGPAFRLIAGVAMVALGWSAAGALGASTVSAFLVMLIGFYFVRDLWRATGAPHDLALGAVSRYSGIVLIGTLAFTMLTNIDLIVVKHFFTPGQAGYYSAASVLGKIILFFPTAVSTILFPKTSHRHALGQDASGLARQSMLALVGLCGLSVAALALFPAPAVHLMFGNQYDGSIGLVGLYGATMGLFALVQLLMTYYISLEEARFVWLLAGVTAVLTVVLAFVHISLTQVIVSLAVSAIGVLVISELWLGGMGLARRSEAAIR